MTSSLSPLPARHSSPGGSRWRGLSRIAWVVVSASMVLIAGCGGQGTPEAEQTASPAVGKWETTTARGLAAGLVEHVGTPSEEPGISAGSNSMEGWISVSAEFERDGEVVPMDLMVSRPQEGEDPPSKMSCEDQGEWILGCDLETAPDGSPVLVLASTEDLTGGISEKGFFVFVINARDDHMVLVIETLPDRRAGYVDFSALPVEIETMKRVATDPLVGLETSAARNDAGEQLRNFISDGRVESGGVPEDWPVDITVGDGTCLLNVPEVGAGWHEVYVIGERGGGRARVIGPDGTVVFESVVFEFGEQGEDAPDYEPPPPDEEGEGEEPYAGFEQPVHFEEGTHQVVCIPTDGVESSVSLLVKPAGPGY